MAQKRTAEEKRIASAFCFAEMALRVAGIEAAEERTAYIKKEKGKWCVKSKHNPDWSGGCYDTKKEAEERLKQVEAAKHAKASSSDGGDWVPAAGGTEEPFLTRGGRRLQYVWQPETGRHAYLDLETDLILSDEEARSILGSQAAGR
jgi:hypothetical protein